jgi:hypothetical protein
MIIPSMWAGSFRLIFDPLSCGVPELAPADSHGAR